MAPLNIASRGLGSEIHAITIARRNSSIRLCTVTIVADRVQRQGAEVRVSSKTAVQISSNRLYASQRREDPTSYSQRECVAAVLAVKIYSDIYSQKLHETFVTGTSSKLTYLIQHMSCLELSQLISCGQQRGLYFVPQIPQAGGKREDHLHRGTDCAGWLFDEKHIYLRRRTRNTCSIRHPPAYHRDHHHGGPAQSASERAD